MTDDKKVITAEKASETAPPAGPLRFAPLLPRERLMDPFGWYEEQRTSAPIQYDEESEFWSVFRYVDVETVLSDHGLFSSRFRRLRQARTRTDDDAGPVADSIISTDPPKHHKLRALVSQAFTPKAVANMEPRIEQITHELLDKVLPSGRMELIQDLASPLPVMVIAEMLGIPTEEREQFRKWSNDLISGSSTMTEEDMARISRTRKEMNDYFRDAINERRSRPRNDLISDLIAAEVDGEHLPEPELLGFCILLLVAGNVTTTNLLGSAFLSFHEHPAALDDLRSEPAQVPSAIEEVLRYRSPVQGMFRVVDADMDFHGHQLKEGQGVIGWIGSANRDPEQFPDPNVFDVRRTPNRHMGFGRGIHFCLGAPLSRLESRVALTVMLERFKEIQVLPGAELEPIDSSFLYGVKRLNLTFS